MGMRAWAKVATLLGVSLPAAAQFLNPILPDPCNYVPGKPFQLRVTLACQGGGNPQKYCDGQQQVAVSSDDAQGTMPAPFLVTPNKQTATGPITLKRTNGPVTINFTGTQDQNDFGGKTCQPVPASKGAPGKKQG